MERYQFILAQEATRNVKCMCKMLGVSRSSFYHWKHHRASGTPPKHAVFDAKVKAAWDASRGRYGSRRLLSELRAQGHVCSRTRVAWSLRRQGLWARGRRKFRATTDSNHTHEVAPNLLERNFSTTQANTAWVGDITYVPTREGWLYLAVLIDLYSRRVVGWATGQHIDRHLVLRALHMAIGLRRPARGLIHHTDRGSQYASRDYRQALEQAGIICSMSRKGDCWDNAPAESFFASIKLEELCHQHFATRDEARHAILEYLAWYNANRRHSTLGYISPAMFEQTRESLHIAA